MCIRDSDDSHVFWTTYLAETALQVPKVGGNPTVLATDVGEIVGVVADAGFAYMAARFTNPGQILRVPVGGGPAVVLADQQGDPAGVAQDDTYLYWANATDGTVMKLAK